MSTLIEDQVFGPEHGDENSALSFDAMSGAVVLRRCKIDGGSKQWGLKFSNCANVLVEDCEITGGTERALDIVRGTGYIFRRCKFNNSGTRLTVTSPWTTTKVCSAGIKGGAENVAFESCEVHDVLLGDYSIYDHNGTRVTKGITFANCPSVIVRGRSAEAPSFLNTPYSMVMWPKLVTAAYFTFQRMFGDPRIGQ